MAIRCEGNHMRFTVAVAMTPAEQYLPLARTADAAGWVGLAVPDSPFFPETVEAKYLYTGDGARYWTGDTAFLDPFVAMPAMARATGRGGPPSSTRSWPSRRWQG